MAFPYSILKALGWQMKIEIEGGSLFWIAWACPYVVDAFHEEFGSFFSQFEWTHPCEAGCALMFMMFVVIVFAQGAVLHCFARKVVRAVVQSYYFFRFFRVRRRHLHAAVKSKEERVVFDACISNAISGYIRHYCAIVLGCLILHDSSGVLVLFVSQTRLESSV